MSEPQNYMELVAEISNRLGWAPDEPRWKHERIAAGLIKKKVFTNPAHLTLGNLSTTVRYMQAHHIPLRYPMGIFYYVDKALLEVRTKGPIVERPSAAVLATIEADIARAVDYERSFKNSSWPDRFIRATGIHRRQVLNEWNDPSERRAKRGVSE
jgi:hypothetical protein